MIHETKDIVPSRSPAGGNPLRVHRIRRRGLAPAWHAADTLLALIGSIACAMAGLLFSAGLFTR